MILTQEEALKIAKTKNYGSKSLHEARELEDRIRLHTVGDDSDDVSVDLFKKWANLQVSAEKYKEFIDVMMFPLPTVGVCENIFDDLSKLFEAENANYEAIRFTKEAGTNGQEYNDKHRFKDIMKNRVFRTFMAHPNSFFVVETNPDNQNKPELYFIHLSNYRGHSYTNDRKLEYLAWQKDSAGKELVVVDEEKFHYFSKKDNSEEYSYTYKIHNLGEVPGDLIYKDFFSDDDTLKVKSPLAKKVGDLDWLLFWKLAKKVLDKSAPFPIYSHYRFPCNFEEPTTGAMCNSGILRWDEEGETGMVGKEKPCPKCSGALSQRMIAGSRIEIPAPESKEDVDLRDPVQVLPAEKVSIEYVTKEEERLENAIFYSVVGKSLVPLESFSASETQIDVATESKKNVFLKMSSVLSATHNKLVRIYAKIEYGTSFLGCDIKYGDNWFLRTPDSEVSFYKAMNEAKAPQQMRMNQLRQVVKNIYSTDSDERVKQLMMIDLEPFVLDDVLTVTQMYMQRYISKETLALKVYFNQVIQDVEAEVGHIGAFLNAGGGTFIVKRKRLTDLVNKHVVKYVGFIQADNKPKPEDSRSADSEASAEN